MVQAFIGSCAILRLQRPPSVRLLDTTTHKFPTDPSFTPSPHTSARSSPAPRPSTEPDLLSGLSLSSTPVVTTAPNPIFGLPSLLTSNPSPHRMDEDSPNDPDAMDWTPTDPSLSSRTNNGRKAIKNDDDGSWLRPQRFFPPEQPTGLEGLFARTLLVDDSDPHSITSNGIHPRRRMKLNWWALGTLVLVPLLGVTYMIWGRWDVTFTRISSSSSNNPIVQYSHTVDFEEPI